MGKKSKYGICKLCGQIGQLSFEHVPPEKAFNNRCIRNIEFEKLIEKDDPEYWEKAKGKQSQRGSGGHTLCIRCNSNTGAWYADEYVDWVYKGMSIVSAVNDSPRLEYPFQIFPLRVFKQIVCMFFSVNSTGFQAKNQELVRFVLNKEQKYIPNKYKFYVAYNLSSRMRSSGVSALVSLGKGENNYFSEISFPPFTYVMSLNSKPPDKRLTDITYFSEFSYNDWKELFLKMNLLPIYSYLPGDYRSKKEVNNTIKKNLEMDKK